MATQKPFIEFAVDDARAVAALRRLRDSLLNPRPVLAEIGEDEVEETKSRFARSVAPDGAKWAANSQVTIDRYLGLSGSNYKENGELSARGVKRLANKKPLIGESRALSAQIFYALSDNAVTIGSNRIQAAVQQFGATRARYPHLWGDIPARPFLGLSDDGARRVESLVAKYLDDALG